jgi:hypothetical protein
VYLDGTLLGTTPLRHGGLRPGRHRLRLSRDGFLDNAREITLAAGEVLPLDVRLTDASSGDSLSEPTDEDGAGGGRLWPWIVGGAAALGAAVAAGAALSGNRGPTAGTVTTEPRGAGLAAATAFTFSLAGAGDPEGDPIAVTWDFGDGGTATGETTTHTFPRAGAFTVTATVSDGRSTSTTAGQVTVRDLAGTWAGLVTTSIGPVPVQFSLAQSGAALTGSYGDEDGPGSVTGSVAAPRAVRLLVVQPGFVPFTFAGTADADIQAVTGTVEGLPFVMTRR